VTIPFPKADTIDPTKTTATFGAIDITDNPGLDMDVEGPHISDPGKPEWKVQYYSQDFELHVMCLAGREFKAVYGGVVWGHSWRVRPDDGSYKHFSYASRSDRPSATFKRLVDDYYFTHKPNDFTSHL